MNLIYYVPDVPESERMLWQMKQDIKPGIRPSICRSLEEFKIELKIPSPGQTIAVLLVPSVIELKELLSIKSLLLSLRIILILPDWRKQTTTMAHKLYPRYMGSVKSDYQDVSAVLKKMINREFDKELV